MKKMQMVKRFCSRRIGAFRCRGVEGGAGGDVQAAAGVRGAVGPDMKFCEGLMSAGIGLLSIICR